MNDDRGLRSARRALGGLLEPDHRAGQRANDAGDLLDLCHDEVPEGIDVGSFRRHDHVVWPGHRFRSSHAFDRGDRSRNFGCFAAVGLDEYECFDHVPTLPAAAQQEALSTWYLDIRLCFARRLGANA